MTSGLSKAFYSRVISIRVILETLSLERKNVFNFLFVETVRDQVSSQLENF